MMIFFKIEKFPLQYVQSKFAADAAAGRHPRPFKASWFTVSNYIRVFAAVIMRGLVSSRDDPDFSMMLCEEISFVLVLKKLLV